MPSVLRNGESPLSFAGLMKARIKYRDNFLHLDASFHTSDLVAYSSGDNARIKFIFTCDNRGRITESGRVALDLINPDEKRCGGDLVAIELGERYDSLHGIEVSNPYLGKLGILGEGLTKNQILNSPVWRKLARNPNEVPKEIAEDELLLSEYVDFIVSKRREIESEAFPFQMMGVYIDQFDEAKLRTWCAGGMMLKTEAEGRYSINSKSNRFISLTPDMFVANNLESRV